ncbi:MAG: YbhB/YbcL family Raf kinase inhibitor-like protein [Candidatus Omnitrophota bacterium]
MAKDTCGASPFGGKIALRKSGLTMIKIRVIFLLVLFLLVFCAGGAMALELKSLAFEQGKEIPRPHTCEGKDASPALSWQDVSSETKSFALICDDPDAPMGTWVHWVLYNIPSDARSLPEGVSLEQTLPDGSRQGVNDFRRLGYGGPCPPPGKPHRYFFKLYALDTVLDLKGHVTKEALVRAMERHILAEAILMGTYKR